MKLAVAHSAHLPATSGARFMAAFEQARTDFATGQDIEGHWLRLYASRAPAATALMAGYIEGLASLRGEGVTP